MRFIRCPKCGSIPSQTIIQTKDNCLYHCMRPLHKLEVHRKEKQIVFKSIPTFCDTIIDQFGKEVKGWISYLTVGIDGLTNPKRKLAFKSENVGGK